MEIEKAIQELKNKSKKRNFVETLDLIINLKNFDPKKEKIDFYFEFPHPWKKNKIGFIVEKGIEIGGIDFIEWNQIASLEPKEFKKKIEKNFDLFVVLTKLVPGLAKKFGKILGPRKKMPDPKVGAILTDLNKEKLLEIKNKLEKMKRVTNDGNSIKIGIGKVNMGIKEIKENFDSFLKELIKILPKAENNIKEILIKFTMSKPIRIK